MLLRLAGFAWLALDASAVELPADRLAEPGAEEGHAAVPPLAAAVNPSTADDCNGHDEPTALLQLRTLHTEESTGLAAAPSALPVAASQLAAGLGSGLAGSSASSGASEGDGILTEPFYMYDDPDMDMDFLRNSCGDWFGRSEPDVLFIEAAKTHPMRTKVASEAKMFLIPIPTTSSWRCSTRAKGGKDYEQHWSRMRKALLKLVNSETWLSTRGNGHVWLIHNWRLHRMADFGNQTQIPNDPERGEWANHRDLVSNVTMLTYENWHGNPRLCAALSQTFGDYCGSNDLLKPWTSEKFDWVPFEYWGCSVVVPYNIADNIPVDVIDSLTPGDSFEDWMARETVLFYRNPPPEQHTYLFNATETRIMPFALSDVPGAKIGLPVPPLQHMKEMINAKFCLMPKGDTPTSHKLYDAIHSLCIPVIISDLFSLVGRSFPTLISWDSFTITIPESVFMANPQQAVMQIWAMSKGELRAKHRALVDARKRLDWHSHAKSVASHALQSAVDLCLTEPAFF